MLSSVLYCVTQYHTAVSTLSSYIIHTSSYVIHTSSCIIRTTTAHHVPWANSMGLYTRQQSVSVAVQC